MMYQRGEHGMEQAHGGYSGGMRRSQSLVQGLFGWISPFHHTGPEPPASSSMDEDGNDDANETFTEASETPLALDPPASPSPDTSLRTNPSPYARKPWAANKTRSPVAPVAFHPGSFETPTKRATNVPFSTSPFAISTTSSPGRRHAPIYFGPGTSTRRAYSPARSGMKSTYSMSALSQHRAPILARDTTLTMSDKRRKTHAASDDASVSFASPVKTPSSQPLDTLRRTVDREARAPEFSDMQEVSEVPEVPVRRSTRAATTMRQVLDSMQPVATSPPKPPVPDVVNPYQTRSSKSPQPSSRSTRARALEAARNRASMTTSPKSDSKPLSLLDVVERTEPRRSARLSVPELGGGSSTEIKDSAALWHVTNRPKRPSPLAMSTPTSQSVDNDVPASDSLYDTIPPSMSDASLVPEIAMHTRTSLIPKSASSFSLSSKGSDDTRTQEAAKGSAADSAATTKPLPNTASSETQLKPLPSSLSHDSPISAISSSTNDIPAWCIVTPPSKRELPAGASSEQSEALRIPHDHLPVFPFNIPPAHCASTLEAPASRETASSDTKDSRSRPHVQLSTSQEAHASSFQPTAYQESKPPTPVFSFGARSTEPPKSPLGSTTPVPKSPSKPVSVSAQPVAAEPSASAPAPSEPSSSEQAGDVPGTNVLTSKGEGEEDEDTAHEVRAKIWRLDTGKWQDMGISIMRVKTSRTTQKSRVLARNAVNGNVVLNFSLYEGLKVTREKNVLMFLGFIEAKPCNLRCKVKTEEAAETLKKALVSHATSDN